MLTEVTAGVKISVVPVYEPYISSPLLDSFIFSYHITISNLNDFPVQLMRRHWYIFDSAANSREVEGAGVVGEKPVIMPGEFFTYHSACDLRSVRGTMKGYYTMQRVGEPDTFHVRIPEFKMEVPFAQN
ncbi:MAG: Co2+/Mg2+ efflux protein ApaG [Crocinitomicaceae bacterium]|nr:Co2+/Mg2+ efflux protein ApaG [Crocinitomicaceae bacterium]